MPPLKSGKRLITLLVQCSAERYVNSLGLIELKFEYCDFVWRLKFPEYLTAVVVIVKYFSGFNVFLLRIIIYLVSTGGQVAWTGPGAVQQADGKVPEVLVVLCTVKQSSSVLTLLTHRACTLDSCLL